MAALPLDADFHDIADGAIEVLLPSGMETPSVGGWRWLLDADGNRAKGILRRLTDTRSGPLGLFDVDWETWVPSEPQDFRTADIEVVGFFERIEEVGAAFEGRNLAVAFDAARKTATSAC